MRIAAQRHSDDSSCHRTALDPVAEGLSQLPSFARENEDAHALARAQ